MNKTSLAARVRELRVRARLTQRGLSVLAGLRGRTVEDLERGRTWPRWDVMCAIAQTLEVPLDSLLEPPTSIERRPAGRPRQAPPNESNR